MSFWNSDKTPAGKFDLKPGSADVRDINIATEAEAYRDGERFYQEAVNTLRSNPYTHPLRQATVDGYMSPKIENRRDRELMLSIRMRVSVDDLPFDDIYTSLGKEKVFVFVVQNDVPVIFEDDIGLFPSDTLVTQLRLIQK